MPPMRQWIKAGFGFTVGAWIALALLAVPSFIVYMRAFTFWLELLTLGARHR